MKTVKGLVFNQLSESIHEVMGISDDLALKVIKAFSAYDDKKGENIEQAILQGYQGDREKAFKDYEAMKNGDGAAKMRIMSLIDDSDASYTGSLESFLDSPEFAALNYPLKSKNDYFMLGYLWHTYIAMSKDISRAKDGLSEVFEKATTLMQAGASGAEVTEALEEALETAIGSKVDMDLKVKVKKIDKDTPDEEKPFSGFQRLNEEIN